MNTTKTYKAGSAWIFCLVLALSLTLPVSANSAPGVPPINIAKTPLNATVTTAPNILYILDDSGSMELAYLPDWAGEGAFCRNAQAGSFNQLCIASSTYESLPPFRSSDFNSIYYNPNIRYTPPKNADGTSMPEQTTWGVVKDDAYGIQSTAVTDLVKNYSDTEWCTSTIPAYADCLRNDNYILPANGINNPTLLYPSTSKNYTVAHKVPAYLALLTTPIAGKVATGLREAPTIDPRFFGPHYYNIIPGEFCDSLALTNCRDTKAGAFQEEAKVRWCTNATVGGIAVNTLPPESVPVNACQATRDATHKVVRYPTIFFKKIDGVPVTTNEVLYKPPVGQVGTPGSAFVPAKPAVGASVTFSLVLGNDCEGSDRARILNVLVNGANILPTPTSATLNANTLAGYVRDGIASTSYIASGSGNSIKLQALPGAGNITFPVAIVLSSGSCTVTTNPTAPKFGGYTAAQDPIPAVPASSDYKAGVAANCSSPVTISGLPTSTSTNAYGFKNGDKVCRTTTTSSSTSYYGKFSRVDIVPTRLSYPKSDARLDCTGANCTYDQEMTNFANWWTYYHTRMQAMKTSTSLAFDKVDETKRVGFSTISDTSAKNSSTFLNIADFGPAHKTVWFDKLFKSKTEGNTPLRSALAQAGRLYANKLGTASDPVPDPVQYSCQTNFALLTTDGYWNGDQGVDLKGVAIGNLDAGSTLPPKKEGATASGTLADVAKYYYDTDLRTPALANCTGTLGAGINVCKDGSNDTIQRMSTYTLGLGVDGTLSYTSDYKEANTGAYADIKSGLKTWPSPLLTSATDEKIDDLWHAAVNGEGRYFSAKNPAEVTKGLGDALTSIGKVRLAGAASGYNDRQLLQVDNFSYRPIFTTDDWTGNIEKRKIDPVTGLPSDYIDNCVENIEAEGTTNKCTGINSLPAAIAKANSGGRQIYFNKGGPLAPIRELFTYDNLTSVQTGYFNETYLETRLSQWSVLTGSQKGKAKEAGLVDFLRGSNKLEDRSDNALSDRIFRLRKAILGDIVDSQPVFVGKPSQTYSDVGYAAYKSAKVGRAATIYIGANDGMLHAFDPDTLAERWAFIPSAVLPKLWYLADRSYNHENYVNATVTVADVFTDGSWKTILVGGFNGGARGYYALDITVPNDPQILWEFTEANMGYTFGIPKVVKVNKKWVVLLTSGYNNRLPGDGGGYLYVLDAGSGQTINTYETGVGTSDAPSGLSKISPYVDDVGSDNTALLIYGGDLAGNIWRFDPNKDYSAGTNPFLLAKVKDKLGNSQPITSAPEIGIANGKRIVFVGTGQYLEPDDRSTTLKQTIYAIKDDNETATLTDPRNVSSKLIEQSFNTAGDTRSTSNNTVDPSDRGWYIDLPDAGERQYLDSQLFGGVLTVITNVPTGTECNPSGYAWLNLFNYKTGTSASATLNGVTAGSFKMLGGAVAGSLFGNGKTPFFGVGGGKGPSGVIKLTPVVDSTFKNKRTIWRELTK